MVSDLNKESTFYTQNYFRTKQIFIIEEQTDSTVVEIKNEAVTYTKLGIFNIVIIWRVQCVTQ